MSAPTIPNLLSLRGARGGRGGRGRGRGGQAGPPGISNEAAIQGTDTDAAVSRLSAVDLGYMHDPYAQYFVQSTGGLPAARRLPIINRGTYTRTIALDALVNSFLSPGDNADSSTAARQIISLGAGTDTRPFRLFGHQDRTGLVYHEIDFDITTTKKLRTVQGTPLLSKVLTNASATPLEGTSNSHWSSEPSTGGEYHCHGLDLRDLPADSPETSLPGLRTDIPTLVLSECCLCYLSPAEATRALEFFTSRIPDLATVLYEPIRPDDAFGKMMVSNLAARRIRMPTVDVYRDGASQDARLRQAGFDTVRHMTVEGIWDTWVAPEERERVDALEGLDEVEEWKLLAAHYIVAWGARGDALAAWGTRGGGE